MTITLGFIYLRKDCRTISVLFFFTFNLIQLDCNRRKLSSPHSTAAWRNHTYSSLLQAVDKPSTLSWVGPIAHKFILPVFWRSLFFQWNLTQHRDFTFTEFLLNLSRKNESSLEYMLENCFIVNNRSPISSVCVQFQPSSDTVVSKLNIQG